MKEDIVIQLRRSPNNQWMLEAADEIERLRKRDAVLELFAKAFHVDEYGQFPVTNGEDVWAAVLAYAQMRVEEARRG